MAFKNFSVGIIGPGKTGLSLAEAFLKTGNLAWILCRNDEKKEEVLKSGFKNVVSEFPFKEIPEVIFITVRDGQISSVVENLLKIHENSPEENLFKNTIFIHTSGALSIAILSPLLKTGARITAAAHPFQTIARPSSEFLKGIVWGIEAEEINHDKITEIITLLDGKPIFLSKETVVKKELYHISAVAASNFLAAAIASARHFAQAAGISEEEFLPAIIQTATQNSLDSISLKNNFPLTGPIARGDVITVERHISALQNNPALLKEYIYFSLATAEIAFKNGIISTEIFDELKAVLKQF